MVKSLIKRLWGNDSRALDEPQTEQDARLGQLHREFAEHPSRGLTPARLYEILEAAEQGDLKAQHELFEDMEEKDPQIAADLATRRQQAAELEWQIVPPDGADAREKQAAEFCAAVFAGLEVEDLILDLGSGIGHGWAHLEIPWSREDGRWLIGQPLFRPHSWFRLHPERQDELRLRDMSATGAALWPLGWVQHRHRAKSGYVARAGLGRVLAWPYLFSNYALGDLAELLEIYGLPAKIGHYPPNASPEEKATLLRAVTRLGHQAAGIIPEGMRIEFLEAAAGRADLFQAMMTWAANAKARAILGNTLTSGTGEGSNTEALGKIHERSQQRLIRSDARQYAGSINRDLLWPLAALNFGIEDRRRAPRFYLDTGEIEDLQVLAESLPVFVDLGARIPAWWFHEKTRIPEAAESEAVLARAGAPGAATPGTSTPGAAATTLPPIGTARSAPTPTDAVADPLAEQLAERAAEPLRDWIEQIRAMAEEADDLEQLRDRLLAAYGDLDSRALAEVMALAFAAADAGGREALLDETGLLDGDN